jgi:RNA 2',3'-cyclic 3'-phosphodiesterase
VRLFVALDLPDQVRHAITELIAKLQPKSRAARWIKPENLHITLKFIGHVGNEKLSPIQTALLSIRIAQSVELHFRGMGFFPNEHHPRAFWCGIASSPNLADLATDIDRALVPLGIEAETRPFTPHLTLARFKSDEGIREVVQAATDMKSTDFGTATETNFHLYESLLKSTGAQYNRVASFPFVGGSTAQAH